MRKIIDKIAILTLMVCFSSCVENETQTPKATFNIDSQTFQVNESLELHFTGVADQVVVYPGDDMHQYELRDQSNTGFVVNKNLFTYAYESPGTYKLVCIASCYNDLAKELLRDTCSVMIRVVDDCKEINRLSCPQILYDEVFAEREGNDWFFRLPQKVKYGTSTGTIRLTQRLSFDVDSDSTKIFIDGNSYVSSTRYNLANTLDIKLTSYEGNSNEYKVYTLYYPEFSSFKVGGVTATIERSEFDYSAFKLRLTLPSDVDLSQIQPVFQCTDNTAKVYLNDQLQESGVSIVDFNQPLTYKVVSQSTDKADFSSISYFEIILN